MGTKHLLATMSKREKDKTIKQLKIAIEKDRMASLRIEAEYRKECNTMGQVRLLRKLTKKLAQPKGTTMRSFELLDTVANKYGQRTNKEILTYNYEQDCYHQITGCRFNRRRNAFVLITEAIK